MKGPYTVARRVAQPLLSRGFAGGLGGVWPGPDGGLGGRSRRLLARRSGPEARRAPGGGPALRKSRGFRVMAWAGRRRPLLRIERR